MGGVANLETLDETAVRQSAVPGRDCVEVPRRVSAWVAAHSAVRTVSEGRGGDRQGSLEIALTPAPNGCPAPQPPRLEPGSSRSGSFGAAAPPNNRVTAAGASGALARRPKRVGIASVGKAGGTRLRFATARR